MYVVRNAPVYLPAIDDPEVKKKVYIEKLLQFSMDGSRILGDYIQHVKESFHQLW